MSAADLVYFTRAGSATWPRASILDVVIDGRGVYGKQTLEQVRAEYPDVELLELGVARLKYNEAFRRNPQRITAKRFDDMLDALPPCNWIHGGRTESFYLSELVAGDIAAYFVRVGTAYFELHIEAGTSHALVVEQCRACRTAAP